MLFTACATMAPPLPPSLDLPQPPSDLRAARKGDKVTLTWTVPSTTTDRQAVRSLGASWICRGLSELKECGTPIGQAGAQPDLPTADTSKRKAEGTYVDIIPPSMEKDIPPAFVAYAVEVLNKDGRGAGISNAVRIPLAHTLPPPQNFQAQVTSLGIVLSWSAVAAPLSQPGVHYLLRIYRSTEGAADRILLREIPLAEGQNNSTTDANIEWQKTYGYRAETVTVVDPGSGPQAQVEGADSPAVKVFADDVFPPAVPSGLQAVFSGPGQKAFIDLVWAPVTDADLAGYNVYRHEEGAATEKINAEVVHAPAYRDVNVQAGKHYLYSVSAIDVRGNESAKSEEAGESVP